MTTIQAFDEFLAGLGLSFDGSVIGGAALNLLGVVERTTKDCDVLAPRIPEEVEGRRGSLPRSDAERGMFSTTTGSTMAQAQWSTSFPTDGGLALCDRGIDLGDCLAMAPSPAELAAIRPWLEVQDGHPDWPAHVRLNLALVARRLGRVL